MRLSVVVATFFTAGMSAGCSRQKATPPASASSLHEGDRDPAEVQQEPGEPHIPDDGRAIIAPDRSGFPSDTSTVRAESPTPVRGFGDFRQDGYSHTSFGGHSLITDGSRMVGDLLDFDSMNAHFPGFGRLLTDPELHAVEIRYELPPPLPPTPLLRD